MLGLDAADLAAAPPLWVDTGSDQLIIPLASFAAVTRVAPRADAMLAHGSNGQRALAYVFAREADHVLSRFFFSKHGSLAEDPGTGSACANLGGWLLATGAALPQKLTLDQGAAVDAPAGWVSRSPPTGASRLGRVIELARGTVTL
jgi:predicted PhzF superfamily epimerase YddE/YHI9